MPILRSRRDEFFHKVYRFWDDYQTPRDELYKYLFGSSPTDSSIDGGGVIPPGLDDYFYLPGRNSGQTGYGGINASESLKLSSTHHATKGKIFLGSAEASAYDEANDRLGLGIAVPLYKLHAQQTIASGGVLGFFKNASNAVGAYSAVVVENETAAHGAVLATWSAAYSAVTGFQDHGGVYSAEASAGMVVASLNGPIEFWLYQGAYPAGSYTHVADVTNDGVSNGILPNADSTYILGSEVGPLRWADASFDQVHIGSYALTMTGAAALNQNVLTTSSPTFAKAQLVDANTYISRDASYAYFLTDKQFIFRSSVDNAYFDLRGPVLWRDSASAYATRLTLNMTTGLLTLTGDIKLANARQATGDVAINGYITLVDSAGATVKLATVA